MASYAIDDFPVPACPKRMRLRSEVGSFTQLTMKSRNACSQETALVRTESRAESVWDFSDFCIEFYDDYQIGKPRKHEKRPANG